MTNKDAHSTRANAGQSTEELKADIDRTREQLGETVEALAAKADVKGRAQQKVSEVSGKLSGLLVSGKDRAAEAGKDIGDAAGDAAGTVQNQAAALASSATAVIGKGRESLPEPARRAVEQASSFVSKYRVQVAAALATVAGLVMIRRRRSRS